MSHRRKPPPPEPGLPPVTGVAICTGRGRHRRLRITDFTDQPEPGAGSKIAWGETSRWDVLAGIGPDAMTLRLKCKLCRRDVRLTEANAEAAIDALRQLTSDGEPVTLDISALPC